MTQHPEYQKGYAAGRRYAARFGDDRHVARMNLAAAIAPAIIANPWGRKVGAEWKSFNDAEGISSTVADLVRAIERKLP